MKLMHFCLLATTVTAVVAGSGNSQRSSHNISIRYNALWATL